MDVVLRRVTHSLTRAIIRISSCQGLTTHFADCSLIPTHDFHVVYRDAKTEAEHSGSARLATHASPNPLTASPSSCAPVAGSPSAEAQLAGAATGAVLVSSEDGCPILPGRPRRRRRGLSSGRPLVRSNAPVFRTVGPVMPQANLATRDEPLRGVAYRDEGKTLS